MFSSARSIGLRLRANFKNPVIRKNVTVHMFGKLLGLAIVMVVITSIFPMQSVSAQDTALEPMTQINALNTVWVLLSAFLVFGMQVGFEMLEAGFARSRESINILVEGIADTCICGITFWAFGYAFMFGAGTPFIGTEGFFLQGLPATFGTTGVPLLAFWVFQFAFADTCSTITSGAMVGRTGFVGDLLYSIGVTGFIYPILGHWAWGPGGFLATMSPAGFLDFAGSTVVHTVGGAISLAGAIALGPRLGRVFKRDGGGPFPPHNIILGAVGGLILWFGWYGFNPGSTLSALDSQGIARVAFNTTLAACSAGLAALLYSYFRGKTWDLGITVNGFLAGLVAITAPCYWVDPIGAFFVGIGGTIAMIAVTELLEHFRVDDPIGAVPVHMGAGIWGTLALGLFASGAYGFATPTGANTTTTITGLFYGGGMNQLTAQIIGSLVVTTAALVTAFALMYLVKLTGTLRVSATGEIEGLDLHEHGMVAYPEYVLHPDDGTPKSLDELQQQDLQASAAAAGD
ncbi:MAG: ammonium transporter [Anaerolineae bacterium]